MRIYPHLLNKILKINLDKLNIYLKFFCLNILIENNKLLSITILINLKYFGISLFILIYFNYLLQKIVNELSINLKVAKNNK